MEVCSEREMLEMFRWRQITCSKRDGCHNNYVKAAREVGLSELELISVAALFLVVGWSLGFTCDPDLLQGSSCWTGRVVLSRGGFSKSEVLSDLPLGRLW